MAAGFFLAPAPIDKVFKSYTQLTSYTKLHPDLLCDQDKLKISKFGSFVKGNHAK